MSNDQVSSADPANGLSRRQFLAAGAGVGAAAMLAGCGGGKSASDVAGGNTGGDQNFSATYNGPAVTLAYWNGFTGGDGPFMRKMVQQFNNEHKNIKVTMNTVQWAEYYQRVPAAVSAGKGPDVAIMHVERLAENAVRRIIVPLDDVAKSLNLQEGDFPSVVFNAGVYKDQRYGIPLDVHSIAQYTNTAQLSKAGVKTPTNREELDAAASKVKASGVQQPFWMPNRWPAHLMFYSLLWQFGGEPYKEDGSGATFDSDAGVQALTWMVEQIRKGYSPRNVAQDSQYVAFKNQRNSMTWDGIWQINDLKSTAPNLKWDISFLPQIGSQQAAWANSHQFTLTRQGAGDQNKNQAARVFIDWISKKSSDWAGAGMIPARNSQRETAAFKATPQAKVAEKIDQVRFFPQIPGLGDVDIQALQEAVTKACLLQSSPQDALKSGADKANKMMEANAKKFGSA